MKHCRRNRIGICIAAWLLSVGYSLAQPGNPMLRLYSPEQYGGSARPTAVAQDNLGFMYFGNSEGVLRYDGHVWQLIETPTEVTTLALGPDSLIYVGGRGRYGRLERVDSVNGKLSYRDLTPKIESRVDSRTLFTEVIGIFTLDDRTVAAVSKKSISRYVVGSARGELPKRPEGNHDITGVFVHTGRVGGKAQTSLYVNLALPGDSATQSLYRFITDFVPTSYEGDSIKLYPRFGIPWRNGQTLVGTSDGRLLTFDGNRFGPIASEVSVYLSRAGMTSASPVGGRYVAIGTASGGCLVLNAVTLKIESVLNLQAGLPDNEVLAVGEDPDGGLWVAHGLGLARLYLNSPVRDLSVYGTLGTINDVAVVGTTLYVATNSGVFRLGTNYAQSQDSDEAFVKQTEARLYKEVEARIETEVQRELYEYTQALNDRTNPKIAARRRELTKLFRERPNPAQKKQLDNIDKNTKLNKAQKETRKKEYIDGQVNFQLELDKDKIRGEVEDKYRQQVEERLEAEISEYRSKPRGKPLPRIEYLGGYTFSRIKGLESKCTQLLVAYNQLLAATSSGLFVISPDKATPLWQPEGISIAQLYQLPSTPTWLMVATTQGVQRFQYAGGWQDRGRLPNLETSVLTVAEAGKGVIVTSTAEGPMIRSDRPFDDVNSALSAPFRVPGYERAVAVRTLLGKARVFSMKGSYLMDYGPKGFTRDSALIKSGLLSRRTHIAAGGTGKLWVTQGAALLRVSQPSEARLEVDTVDWANAFGEVISLVASDTRAGMDATPWVVAGGRLYRVPSQEKAPEMSRRFRAYVSALATASDSTFDPENRELRFEGTFEGRDVTIYFSSPSYAQPTGAQFRYRFVAGPGRTEQWSDWLDGNYTTLTGLKAGRYIIEVEAKDLFGRVSGRTKTTLTLPRKIWEYEEFQWAALALGIITVGGGSFGFVRWRTRALEEKNRQLEQKAAELNRQREALLHNILPPEIARELEQYNEVTPQLHKNTTVLFTDFKGFTTAAAAMKPKQLVEELNACFSEFDQIIEQFRLEKIKTIGDAYMAAAGVPSANSTHAVDAVLAGLAIQNYMAEYMRKRRGGGKPIWELRLGIHSGPLVAGVIGTKKFAYDIWGDTVNTAARMESSGEVNRVNISAATYALVKEYFSCTHRGEVEAKGKGKLDMYFVEGLKAQYIDPASGPNAVHVPNALFWQKVGRTEAAVPAQA